MIYQVMFIFYNTQDKKFVVSFLCSTLIHLYCMYLNTDQIVLFMFILKWL